MGQEDQELLIRGGAASKHPSAEQLHEVSRVKNRSILTGDSVRTNQNDIWSIWRGEATAKQAETPPLPTVLPSYYPWRPQPHCISPKCTFCTWNRRVVTVEMIWHTHRHMHIHRDTYRTYTYRQWVALCEANVAIYVIGVHNSLSSYRTKIQRRSTIETQSSIVHTAYFDPNSVGFCSKYLHH